MILLSRGGFSLTLVQNEPTPYIYMIPLINYKKEIYYLMLLL